MRKSLAAAAAILAFTVAAPAQAQRTLAQASDWLTAVRVVQAVYPGSGPWLLSCSASEGGHGGFVWLEHRSYPRYGANSTPGGWMQYMQTTFNSDFDAALRDLWGRGYVTPNNAGYYTPLGQAIAAGWAYSHARPAGKWTGRGC